MLPSAFYMLYPCPGCAGNGRDDCATCQGEGRITLRGVYSEQLTSEERYGVPTFDVSRVTPTETITTVSPETLSSAPDFTTPARSFEELNPWSVLHLDDMRQGWIEALARSVATDVRRGLTESARGFERKLTLAVLNRRRALMAAGTVYSEVLNELSDLFHPDDLNRRITPEETECGE